METSGECDLAFVGKAMRTITLAEHCAWLERRKQELGLTGDAYVPVNSGTRRTPEKRALLKRLEQIRRSATRPLRFTAKY